METQVKRSHAWPPELDAMVAAPDHHDLLLENDAVRVIDSLLKAGESTPVHTHRWPAVQYIIGFSDFVRFDANGQVLLDSRDLETKPSNGVAIWSGPLEPHYVTNIGDNDLRVVAIELKS